MFAQKSQPQAAGSLLVSPTPAPNRSADRAPPALFPELNVRRFDFGSIPIYGPEGPRPHAPLAVKAPAMLGHRATAEARVLQAKRDVGNVDDPLEREADRVADAIMRSPTAVATTTEEGENGVAGRAHSETVARDLSSAPAGKVQRKLVATGDGAGFASLANTVIAAQFTVRVAANGEVTLVSSNVNGPLTADAQELVRTLRNAIGNAKTVTIRFVHGQTSTDPADARILIGGFRQSKIDLDDVRALGIHTSGTNAGAALTHEISEQFEKQVTGANEGTAHVTALQAEARAVGATRIAASSRAVNATTVETTISYRYPNGGILDLVMFVTKGTNNITDVVRTWRP
ncbi:hypothetical protein [Pendulispora albinea]|uniref:Uncharacterized protein n=1 Tax=Pendulispora albinea TaxID=2741071 RepID=A0ABZ2LLL1_9BACT